MNGFTVEFDETLRCCRIIDDRGRKLLAVAVEGDLPLGRRDRISRLATDLFAECQGREAVVAPFDGGEPS